MRGRITKIGWPHHKTQHIEVRTGILSSPFLSVKACTVNIIFHVVSSHQRQNDIMFALKRKRSLVICLKNHTESNINLTKELFLFFWFIDVYSKHIFQCYADDNYSFF